uniref:Interleukin-15 receptor subunit alpha n=1 Tax=Fundulus heteroclitus TaxID=8078 RepID=A0A3Q2P361_FUNHE
MGPRRAFSSACVLIMALLGAARLSSGAKCRCSEIREVELAVPKDGCSDTEVRHRYSCIPGYVREAGTSDVIQCEEKDGTFQWSEPTLKCIPDPRKPRSTSRVAKCRCSDIHKVELAVPKDGCSDTEERHRYDCIPGYVREAGTSNLIRCEEKDGTFQWSEPTLKCIPDPKKPRSTSSPGTSTSLPSVRTSTSAAAKSTDTGTSTNLKNVRTSTSEAATSSNTELTTLGEGNRMKLGDDKAVGISLSVVILLFAICCIIVLLYRRRNRKIPPKEAEELEPMNETQNSVL